jgi:RNA recognition motif-containing protein
MASPRNEAGPTDPAELRELQQKLAKALANPPDQSLQTTSALKSNHSSSCCSLSTMAPDDASDLSECPQLGQWGLRHIESSVSVSTMASDDCDAVLEDVGANRNRSVFEPSHSLVPRHQNWADMQDITTRHEEPTTMMIRNIPSRYTQQDLVLDLQEFGLTGTFDFLYIPMDRVTAANVGYAFVNFSDPHWARKCMQSFHNYRFARHSIHGSKKVATVSVAHLQGLSKNLEHYAHSAVNSSKHAHRRPIVMATISTAFD